MYENAAAERAAVLREEYPTFWDEESETFTGSLSTNAIEGGNWRLKYGLRTPYARVPHDSIYVFRNGRPEVSFTHRVGEFGYEDVMGQSVGPTGPVLTNCQVKTAA